MIAIIDKQTEQIILWYHEGMPNIGFSDTELYAHVPQIEGLELDEMAASKDGDEFILEPQMSALIRKKENEIRSKRNAMLKVSDARWIELFTKNLDKAPVESDKEALRNMMTNVSTDLQACETAEDIKNYDPFVSMVLNWNYEE